MSKVYFGFALADSMFSDGLITRRTLAIDEVKSLVNTGVESCCNPSHGRPVHQPGHRAGHRCRRRPRQRRGEDLAEDPTPVVAPPGAGGRDRPLRGVPVRGAVLAAQSPRQR